MVDYEKAYKEALAKAREIRRNEDEKKFDIEWLFPELKESEDERIRKSLLDFLESVWHLGKNAPFEKWDKSDCSKWMFWLEKQGTMIKKTEHKFSMGDIISNGKVVYRVGGIVKNCVGEDCYFLVDIKKEKNGMRYAILLDPEGNPHNSGEITWLCEQVDVLFEKQGEQRLANNKEKLDLLNFIRKETGCGLAEANNALLKLIKALKQHPFPIMDKPRKLKIEWEE